MSAVMDLKRCPFCGYADPIIHGDSDLFWVECMDRECCAEGPMRDTEKQAVGAWNKAIRVQPNTSCHHLEWCPECNPTLRDRA